MLTVRQLKYLVALSKTGHFGQAAELAGISQPALSTQIRQMEDMLGIALIERLPQGALLTDAGRDVAARAVRILSEIDDIEAASRMRADMKAGSIRLGIIPSIGPFLMPRFLPLLAETFPDLDLDLRETITDTLVAELAAGDLDVIIASLPLGRPGFVEETAFDDPFLLALPARSAPAGRDIASGEMVHEDELILLEDGHCLRSQILTYCGVNPNPRNRAGGVTSLKTLIELVGNGYGVTLLPRLYADTEPVDGARVRLLPFAEPGPKRPVGLAWRRSNPREAVFRSLVALVERAGDHAARQAA